MCFPPGSARIDPINPSNWAGSNFLAVVDPETCIGCTDCVERCQMDALEMEGEIVGLGV